LYANTVIEYVWFGERPVKSVLVVPPSTGRAPAGGSTCGSPTSTPVTLQSGAEPV
jgi:hypothetical protein